MKKIRKVISGILLILLLCGLLGGCYGHLQNESGIQKFYFTAYEGNVTLSTTGFTVILREDGTAMLVEQNLLDKTVKASYVIEDGKAVEKALVRLILRCGLEDWDGFHEIREDGEPTGTFHLQIVFRDGEVLNASGHNSFPDSYEKACKAIFDYLESLRQ